MVEALKRSFDGNHKDRGAAGRKNTEKGKKPDQDESFQYGGPGLNVPRSVVDQLDNDPNIAGWQLKVRYQDGTDGEAGSDNTLLKDPDLTLSGLKNGSSRVSPKRSQSVLKGPSEKRRASIQSTSNDKSSEHRSMPIRGTSTIQERRSIEISNENDLRSYFGEKWREIGQSACKLVAKAFVKFVEPKKQSLFPYTKGAEFAPGWWPSTKICQHKEPDHQKKGERVFLLGWILFLVADESFRNRPDTVGDIAGLKLATDTALAIQYYSVTENDNDKIKGQRERTRRVLKEIFQIAKQLERFKNGEIDGTTIVHVRHGDASVSSPVSEEEHEDSNQLLMNGGRSVKPEDGNQLLMNDVRPFPAVESISPSRPQHDQARARGQPLEHDYESRLHDREAQYHQAEHQYKVESQYSLPMQPRQYLPFVEHSRYHDSGMSAPIQQSPRYQDPGINASLHQHSFYNSVNDDVSRRPTSFTSSQSQPQFPWSSAPAPVQTTSISYSSYPPILPLTMGTSSFPSPPSAFQPPYTLPQPISMMPIISRHMSMQYDHGEAPSYSDYMHHSSFDGNVDDGDMRPEHDSPQH